MPTAHGAHFGRAMGKKRRVATGGTGEVGKLTAAAAAENQEGGDTSSSPASSPPHTPPHTPHPIRHHADLYCQSDSYSCATQRLCVPCAYKLCAFDVALDLEFTRNIPNARPEACPRLNQQRPGGSSNSGSSLSPDNSNNGKVGPKDGTLGYRRGMTCLTVGDGDLSFSLALARLLLLDDNGSASRTSRSRLVASSYESKSTLLRVYPRIQETINELESLGVSICYEVDATNLVDTLPQSVLGEAKGNGNYPNFHRIVWNFPCSAVGSGQDGQNDAMEFNRQLVRDFVRNATNDLLDSYEGEIHMLHKTKPPFNHWKIEAVALEGLRAAREDRSREFEYKGRVAFDRCTMPPYVPRKALDKKSFTCHDACTYIFGWKTKDAASSSTSNVEGGHRRWQPTITSNQRGTADLDDFSGSSELGDEPSIIPVTKEMLTKIRRIHITGAAAKAAAATSDGNRRRNKKKKRRKR